MIGNYTRFRKSGEASFLDLSKSRTFWEEFFTGLFTQAKSGAWTGTGINFGNFQFTMTALGNDVGFDVIDKNNNNDLIKFAKDTSNLNTNACIIRAYAENGGTSAIASYATRILAKVTSDSCSCNYVITDDAIILWAPRAFPSLNNANDNENDATYLMIFRLNTNGSEVTLAAWSSGIESGWVESTGNNYFAPVSLILNKNGDHEIDAWVTGTEHTLQKGLGTHLALQNSKNGAGDRDSFPIVYDEIRFDKRLWMPMIFAFENIMDPELTIGTKNLYNSHLFMSSPYKSITNVAAQGTNNSSFGLEKPCFTYVTLGKNKKGIRLPYIFTQFQEGKYALFDTVYFYEN